VQHGNGEITTRLPICQQRLPWLGPVVFSVSMFSRNHLFRASALLALGLFTFGQTNLAEETIAPAVSDVDNDLDRADTEEDDASQTSYRVHATQVGGRPSVRSLAVSAARDDNHTRQLWPAD